MALMHSSHTVVCPGPRVSRRTILTAGAMSAVGLSLADVLKARAADTKSSSGRKKVKGVILAFASGAPSHIDTLDPKPDAPAEIRGSFSTIATAIPGVRFTEH